MVLKNLYSQYYEQAVLIRQRIRDIKKDSSDIHRIISLQKLLYNLNYAMALMRRYL